MKSLTGKGIYAWVLSNCERGNMTRVVDQLKEAQMTHVIPKIADGVVDDSNGNNLYLKTLVDLCHKNDIQVLGYHYIYGRNPIGEARSAIRELEKLPYDGFVINAEHEYRDMQNGATAARTYCDYIRQKYPNLPFALSTYRYPSLHRNFPYNAFLSYCQYNMPQVYWAKASGMAAHQLSRCISEYQNYVNVPMIPTGAAYQEWGWVATPQDQEDFINAAIQNKLVGCNWWEYRHAFHINPGLGERIINTPFKEKEQETPMPDKQPLTKLYFPCDPRWPVTQRFGVNAGVYTIARGHNGVDFGLPVGNPIYAAADGVVEQAVAQTFGYGRHVRIRHSYGLTIYGHLSRMNVKVGDRVKAMQVIGLSGGDRSDPYAGMSTGPHLHFEYRHEHPIVPLVPGSHVYHAVDPWPLLVRHDLPEAQPGDDYYLIYLTGNLTFRSSTEVLNTNIIGYLGPQDSPFKSFEKAKDTGNRDWYKITHNNRVGWIAGYTQWTNIHRIKGEVLPEDPLEPPQDTLEWLNSIHTTKRDEHPPVRYLG